MVASLVYSAIPQSLKQTNIYKNELTLESKERALSADELSESSKILSKRLEDYGIKLFTIFPVNEKSQIRISFKEKQNVLEILDLLCSKGQLYFAETYSGYEILSKLNKNDLIFSMLNAEKEIDRDNYSAKLGECKRENAEKLSQHLGYTGFRSQVPEDARFAWGKVTAENANSLSLYTLKIDPDKPIVIDGKTIKEIKVEKTDEKYTQVYIQFSENGAGLWAKMTHDNMNRSIAILMDQQVYFTPVVKSEIKGGNCVLTGDFTKDEMKSFVSIVRNGELPASFQLK